MLAADNSWTSALGVSKIWAAIGSACVYEVQLWERIRLNTIMESEHPLGKEL